jgi:drug/metabolite transporter (DMT)-like permease
MGLLYVIIANFFWATELILIRKFFPTQNSFVISAVTCIMASLFYVPALFVYKQKFSVNDWIILAILGFTSWFLAQLFYVTGIQKSPNAALATLATLTMPFCALIMGIIFLKEPLTIKAIIGGIFMIAGFLVISL